MTIDTAFAALFELAADAIFIVGRDGAILDVNAAACRQLGYDRAELLRLNVADFARMPMADPRLQKLESLRSVVIDSVSRRKDGSVIETEVSFAPLHFRGQGAACCIARDVTERRRAEQALRESEQRFRELAELLPQAVFECDERLRFTFLNRRGLELLGLTEADLAAGLTVQQVVPAEDVARILSSGAEALAGRLPAGVGREYRMRRSDGRLIDVMTYTAPIVRDGRPTGLRGVGVDMTATKQAALERQRLESKMLQAQKLESLGLLAGGVAHDFNNLLFGILGNADLALADPARATHVARRLEQIKRGAQRASELANQMLAYAGKGQAQVERLDLSDAVEEVSGLVQAAVTQRSALRLELAASLPAVEADVTQVRQVVMNLILNAAESLGEVPGLITLRTGVVDAAPETLADAWGAEGLQPGRFAFVEVADTGCGMDEATSARIFDPFFTTKFTGRGLGLAAVLGIVRHHRGAITVTSKVGVGTTFRVLLPVAGPGAAPDAPRVAEPEWRGRGTVLVVDDEEEVREVAGEMLRTLGFEVVAVADAPAALAAAARHRRELVAVLLDVTMPAMSGIQAYPKLRELLPDVGIVIASGFGERDVARRFAPGERTLLVQKPFGLTTLQDKLRAVIKR